MDPYKIIVRPLITEKGTSLNEDLNQYAFEVHEDANKLQVAEAVKSIYGVRVVSVRTMNWMRVSGSISCSATLAPVAVPAVSGTA